MLVTNPIELTSEELAQQKAQQKAEREARFRAKRKLEQKLIVEDYHKAMVDERNQEKLKGKQYIGFRAKRLFKNGLVENLPTEYAFILKACEEFITNPKRFPALYAWGGEGIRNIQCRTLLARVLACILPNTDLIGGRIGDPSEAGMHTISWNTIAEDYALRFGEYISPESLARAVKRLKLAGYLRTERINVTVNATEGTIRSAAAYKQFSEKFFSDLNVVRYSNIVKSILETRKRQRSIGKRFSWISRRELSNKVQEIYNATNLNTFAEQAAHIFHSYKSFKSLTPH